MKTRRVSADERDAIRAGRAAGASVGSLVRRFRRRRMTVMRALGLAPRLEVRAAYLFDLRRERTALDRAVDRALCALAPGYLRVVEAAEAEIARRRRGR